MTLRNMAPADGGISLESQRDEAEARQAEIDADADRAVRWAALQALITKHYQQRRRFDLLIASPAQATWGVIATEIAGVMRWDEFLFDEPFGQALRACADADGWADIWKIFARAMQGE